jgi:DNA adenine methylase
MVKRLVAMIPPHRVYVEPFCGSAKLLFSKPPASAEVINDIHHDLMNFFRVVKHRPAALAEMLARSPVHRSEFARLKALKGTDNELCQAYRFFYLTRHSFATKGEHLRQDPPCNIGAVRASLRGASRRLAAVLIECRDFQLVVKRYDSRETFFYCDPPYAEFSENGRYVAGGGDAIFAMLSRIKGKFLLSYNWDPKIASDMRKLGFFVSRISTRYSLNNKRGAHKPVVEMLVRNYVLKGQRSNGG